LTFDLSMLDLNRIGGAPARVAWAMKDGGRRERMYTQYVLMVDGEESIYTMDLTKTMALLVNYPPNERTNDQTPCRRRSFHQGPPGRNRNWAPVSGAF
jgi:hypothetical protein